MNRLRPALAIDLDATVAQYNHAGFSIDEVGEPFIDKHGMSALVFIRKLYEAGYELWVYTARASQPGGDVAVLRWLREQGVDHLIEGVTATKHFFFHRFVDDRAIPFTDDYSTVLTALGVSP